MLDSLTFLTPPGALVGAAVLLPLAAAAEAARRTATARTALGLRRPRLGIDVVALAALVLTFVLLGLAATQPALSHTTVRHVRKDAQVLFVLDTSRSMAASASRTGPTRIARAKRAAIKLRATIPDIAAGVATMTDRVLPDLLPVADIASFNATVQRSVGIEQPPPRSTSVRATTFASLADIPSSGFFDPLAARRTIVLLTDGESRPFDPSAVARSLSGVTLMVVRVGKETESVYAPSGRPETAYRPDPSAAGIIESLAAATGGDRALSEDDLGTVAANLRAQLGSGPTSPVVTRTRSETPLAPFVALLALLPLTILIARRSLRGVRFSVS
jgi:hypothetical protein